jgi:molecular chaperone HtpG
MAADVHATQVDLGGLMTVLGSHLYSTPAVVVRELVQNAHDSIVRRRIEDPAFAADAGRIEVVADPARGTLFVRDDGAGMTRDEVGQYLATVGVGYTRGLRDRADGNEDTDLIGLFGLGFLSAFVIAEHTIVRTASYQEGAQAVEYRSRTGEQYALLDAGERPTGTEVELRLAKDHQGLADPATLRQVTERYCRLLEIPVHVDGERVNAEPPPWRDTGAAAEHPVQRRRRRMAFAARADPAFNPLCTIDVEPAGDSDARGLLWVQDAATYGSWDNRRLAVYVRGMLLDDDARELLPRWAGFVSGAIESRSLTPTASREDLQRDAGWQATAKALQEALIAGLSDVARNQPEAWTRVLVRHNEALLGAALADPRLDELLADDLHVPTSEGDMTVRELVERGGGRAHVGLGHGGFEEMRFRALKVQIATGTRYAVLPFLRQWCNAHGVELAELGTRAGDRALFQRRPLDDAERAWLAEQLAGDGQEVVPAGFDPPEMPFVLVPDREAELKRRLEEDEARERISTAALHLAHLHTRTIDGARDARLYVNVDSPAIAALLEARRAGAETGEAVRLLRAVLALMAAGEREVRGGVDLQTALADVGTAVARLAGAPERA